MPALNGANRDVSSPREGFSGGLGGNEVLMAELVFSSAASRVRRFL